MGWMKAFSHQLPEAAPVLELQLKLGASQQILEIRFLPLQPADVRVLLLLADWGAVGCADSEAVLLPA